MNTIMLVPIGINAFISIASEAILNEVKKSNSSVTLFSPITSKKDKNSISLNDAANFLAKNEEDKLLEQIIENFSESANQSIVFVEGVNNEDFSYASQLNYKIAQTVSAKIIFVINAKDLTIDEINTQIALAKTYFGGHKTNQILGVALINAENSTKINSLPVIATISNETDLNKTNVCKNWINALNQSNENNKLSPPAFRYKLTKLARQANKTIVLPEGDEPRTIKAAAICAEKGIAKCVLLADPNVVKKVAVEQGVSLGENIEIIDPNEVRQKYVARLVELRSNKGMTEELANAQLADNVVLGTMMLEADHVDGLVSGAVHTTANTIRPPLQIIKTAPGSKLVSSVFFMLMPDQVYIYGDCAINPNPTAENLADIAIQSADTAKAFGLDPKVAMISYSTGSSGQGVDVEKVTEATNLVKQIRPDIIVDGPLQYDAAVMPDVAKSKAPNSLVAGQANVFVFPDLNTGNTTYKAVQRSADLISIGPMLQGMRKPVNDLSRGALVDDIVYTIALTAIQATQ